MAMRKVKITYIHRTDKVWKSGKNKGVKYVSVGIKIEEKGFNAFINGVGDALNKSWKIGDELDLDIKKKILDDGRVFYNFKNPTAKDSLADLIERVEALENIIKAGKIIGNGETVHQANRDDEQEKQNLPI